MFENGDDLLRYPGKQVQRVSSVMAKSRQRVCYLIYGKILLQNSFGILPSRHYFLFSLKMISGSFKGETVSL